MNTDEILETEIAKPEIVVKNVVIRLPLQTQTHPNRTKIQVDIIDAAVEAFPNLQEIREDVKILFEIRLQIMKHNIFNLGITLCH